jgi:hypothetical protein
MKCLQIIGLRDERFLECGRLSPWFVRSMCARRGPQRFSAVRARWVALDATKVFPITGGGVGEAAAFG